MQSKEQKIEFFDPNELAATDSNIYGLPFSEEESQVIILPLPWDVTVSYNDGTSNGPEAIFNASRQVDLYDAAVEDAWKIGHFMQPINENWKATSKSTRKKAIQIIEELENGSENIYTKFMLDEVNKICAQFHYEVEEAASKIILESKIVIGLGGDHSTPLGIIKALATKYPSFGVLQFDAHCDLRDAYEGFTYSHASIMYNVLKEVKQVSKLVQIGIRDYCEAELNYIKNSNERVVTFFDRYLKQQCYEGRLFSELVNEIIQTLPDTIYISFDIDALDPKLCPHTGTPVAGGFELEQVFYLLEKIVDAGKKIIGGDINEVSPDKDSEWDANVGARLLYRFSNLIAKSNHMV